MLDLILNFFHRKMFKLFFHTTSLDGLLLGNIHILRSTKIKMSHVTELDIFHMQGKLRNRRYFFGYSVMGKYLVDYTKYLLCYILLEN